MLPVKRDVIFECELTATSATGDCRMNGNHQELTLEFSSFATLLDFLETMLPHKRVRSDRPPAAATLLQQLGIENNDIFKLATTIFVVVASKPLLRVENRPAVSRGWLLTRLGLPPVQFEQATLGQRWRLLRLYLKSRSAGPAK